LPDSSSTRTALAEIIAGAAPHRPDAYAASRYAIERVKAILPV